MTLYHGTSFERGKEIIKGRELSNRAERIYKTGNEIYDTSDNLLFLTHSILWALKFAFNAKIITKDNNNKIIIFKVNDFNTDDLLVDKDEYKLETQWGNFPEIKNGLDSLNNDVVQ